MPPQRISIVTLNLWNDNRWPERKHAVQEFFRRFDPDVVCLQETDPKSLAAIDEALPDHDRIEGDFHGWEEQGTIYWRESRFESVEHEAVDIGIFAGGRRLFLTRLALEGNPEKTFLVGTAHLTYQRNDHETETGESPRLEQTERAIETLGDRRQPGEPVFFMGDLNDAVHPSRLLQEAGYSDCFTDLHLQPPATFPVWPPRGEMTCPGARAFDWIFANDVATSRSATVPKIYIDEVPPSDHWPVVALYELDD